MKLRVVGWVCYDDDYPEGIMGWAARNAVIDDIRAHGYEFSGWAHQEGYCCAPLLNDGKIYRFSQRGWGDVMAEAHGYMGEMDYCRYAFMTDSANETRPEGSYRRIKIKPERDLKDSFAREVTPEEFAAASQSLKITFPSYEDLRYLDIGDEITLSSGENSAKYTVKDVERTRQSSDKALVLRVSLSA